MHSVFRVLLYAVGLGASLAVYGVIRAAQIACRKVSQ